MTTLVTTPGDAIFEVATRKLKTKGQHDRSRSHDESNMKLKTSDVINGIQVDVAEMKRLNKYGDTSSCVPKTKELLRKICLCV